uniref:Uncharacterized protein n=1 Tax=Thermosporothrix sp. COM3 TaxID=2490863 RepID=A0A455SPB5_9CHLR|nr:hypothetical protein KTC_27960 [Thermosporothrix sp. COM3]
MLNIRCSIGIKEQLDSSWQGWFEDLQILPQVSGTTILYGYLIDQAALYQVLLKINSLGLTLLSLQTQEVASLQGRAEKEIASEKDKEHNDQSYRFLPDKQILGE